MNESIIQFVFVTGKHWIFARTTVETKAHSTA